MILSGGSEFHTDKLRNVVVDESQKKMGRVNNISDVLISLEAYHKLTTE